MVKVLGLRMKCDTEYIKMRGWILGFSIDAFLKLKEVNLKSNINMSEIKTGFAKLTDDLLVALGLNKPKRKQ